MPVIDIDEMFKLEIHNCPACNICNGALVPIVYHVEVFEQNGSDYLKQLMWKCSSCGKETRESK